MVATLALTTRALHLDGLADTFDGLGAAGSTERALAIMKRGDIGPMGAVALIVVLGVTAIAATPAHAAYSNCPSNAICVWPTRTFTMGNGSGGPMYYWTNPGGGCINFGAAINDQTASAANNATWIATFYVNANCSGSLVVTLSAFGAAGNYRNCDNSMGDGNAYWNNSASGCTTVPNTRRISSVWVA